MAVTPKRRILLVFGEAHATPEVVWSLRDAGFDLGLIFRRDSRSPARRLAGVEPHEITDPAQSFEDTRNGFLEIWARSGYDAVMPLDDPGLFLTHSLEPEIPVIGPPADSVALALDKRRQFLEAAAAGFRVASWESWPTATPGSPGVTEGRPVIVKPALAGWLHQGGFTRGRTDFHASRSVAMASLERSPPGYEVLVQEVVRGTGEGIFGVATSTRLASTMGHRRLRMTNPAGSGSCACVSRCLESGEEEQAHRFLAACDWRGLFMIETIREQDGSSWFMELNGRPWGSLALARRQGLEYPAWTARQELLGEQPPDLDGRPGVVCRHLGRELIHLLFLLRGNRSGAPNWPTLRERLSLVGWRPSHRWYNRDRSAPGYFLGDAWFEIRSRLSKGRG